MTWEYAVVWLDRIGFPRNARVDAGQLVALRATPGIRVIYVRDLFQADVAGWRVTG